MKHSISDFKVLEVVERPSKEVIDYGVEMIGAPLEWKETKARGIKVGIIDTGVDLEHEDLRNRVKSYVNFTTDDTKAVYDENGHGTHVANTYPLHFIFNKSWLVLLPFKTASV